MMNTSIGFHTLAISQKCKYSLLDDFYRYKDNTGLIVIRKIPKTNTAYIIEYKRDVPNRGVTWKIWRYTTPNGFKYSGVEAVISPQILLGTNNYVAISNESHYDRIVVAYNSLAKEISPRLPLFADCSAKRTDPCINFDLQEMGYCCTPNQKLELMKRGDIPYNCVEYMEYDDAGHRKKRYENSFYLICESFTINCYWKQAQLKSEASHRIDDIANGENVIRFELQRKYDKTFWEKQEIKASLSGLKPCNYTITKELLSDLNTVPAVIHYFEKVITTGDYYPLKKAIAMVEAKHYRRPRQERMIAALKLVSKHKSIAKARGYCATEQTADQDGMLTVAQFNISLQDLVGNGDKPGDDTTTLEY